jgi:predicted DNA binding protein
VIHLTVADIRHEKLALTPTIESHSNAELKVISQSATDPDTGKFFFRVENADDDFESALDGDNTVSSWTRVSEEGDARIYRIGHTDDTILLSPIVTSLSGLMLEAESNDRGWTVRLLFSGREALSELWKYCETNDIEFTLKRTVRQEGWESQKPSTLTDAQREALVTAYEKGYFEEPHDASLADIADSLDISSTAVSGRIRRGTAQLIESSLLDE